MKRQPKTPDAFSLLDAAAEEVGHTVEILNGRRESAEKISDLLGEIQTRLTAIAAIGRTSGMYQHDIELLGRMFTSLGMFGAKLK